MNAISLPVQNGDAARRAFTMHARAWRENFYVYPVVSRRSKGVSIGINLNPDKACNFDCIYCSVDRTVAPKVRRVDLGRLCEELAAMLAWAKSGDIYQADPFDKIPAELRRINDIAFSGDGEPTTYARFAEVCRIAADLKSAAGLSDVKLVLITNATVLQRAKVREGLAVLDANNGEIWAKLDAGTEAYYQLVDRTKVTLKRVLENILGAARVRPIVIQSLFMKVRGEPPAEEEIGAYVKRLEEIQAAGGKIKLVQVYTVARKTTEDYVTALTPEELNGIAAAIRRGLPAMPIEVYP